MPRLQFRPELATGITKSIDEIQAIQAKRLQIPEMINNIVTSQLQRQQQLQNIKLAGERGEREETLFEQGQEERTREEQERVAGEEAAQKLAVRRQSVHNEITWMFKEVMGNRFYDVKTGEFDRRGMLENIERLAATNSDIVTDQIKTNFKDALNREIEEEDRKIEAAKEKVEEAEEATELTSTDKFFVGKLLKQVDDESDQLDEDVKRIDTDIARLKETEVETETEGGTLGVGRTRVAQPDVDLQVKTKSEIRAKALATKAVVNEKRIALTTYLDDMKEIATLGKESLSDTMDEYMFWLNHVNPDGGWTQEQREQAIQLVKASIE